MTRFKLPIAAHVFFVRAGCVLLVQRQNTGFEDGNYGLPAGHLEPGESVTHAAIRECREEIGIIPFVRRAIEQQLVAGCWFDEDGWR